MSKREEARQRALQRLQGRKAFSEQLSQEQLDALLNYDGPINIGPDDSRFKRKDRDHD
jgi:hypothetical protein